MKSFAYFSLMVVSNSSVIERSSFLPTISVCSFGGVLLSHMLASDVVLALAEFRVTPSDSIRAQRAQLLEELLSAQPAAPVVEGIMVVEGQLASLQRVPDPESSSVEQAAMMERQRVLEEELSRVSSLYESTQQGASGASKKSVKRGRKKSKAKSLATSDSSVGSDSSVEIESKASKFVPQSIIPILNTVSDDLDVNVNRVSVFSLWKFLCNEVLCLVEDLGMVELGVAQCFSKLVSLMSGQDPGLRLFGAI